MSAWETDEMLAAQFVHFARAEARRVAWLVQEAIGCEEEVKKMPLVAEELQKVLNNLNCAVSHLSAHRRRWLRLAKPFREQPAGESGTVKVAKAVSAPRKAAAR
jgi:hypothetical protein